MIRPRYISPNEWEKYRAAYQDEALRQYGPDWQTCTFGWSAALTIGGQKDGESK